MVCVVCVVSMFGKEEMGEGMFWKFVGLCFGGGFGVTFLF